MQSPKYKEMYSKNQRIDLSQVVKPNLTILEVKKKSGCCESHIRKEFHRNGVLWKSIKSKYENEIFNFLKDDLKIKKILVNSRNVISPKELDFYLPDFNIAIEVNGIYFHSSKFKNKNYHKEKTELCENLGITLLQIYDIEWDNKKEIWKSIIKAKCGLIDSKISARCCEFREISSKDAKLFCEDNHLDGGINSKYNYGLFFNEELVQVATFGKSRFEENVFELYRFCSKINMIVVGGFSKLLNTN